MKRGNRRGPAYAHNAKALRNQEMAIAEQAERVYRHLAVRWQPGNKRGAAQDVRPLAGALSLDHEGFELHRHETVVHGLYDDDAVETVYYPEIEALLRSVTGGGRVVIFDAARRSDGGAGAKNRDLSYPDAQS